MTHIRISLVAALISLVSFASFGQGAPAGEVAVKTSNETATRTVEDGGSGNHSAIMASDESLPTHTVFRPKDVAAVGE